MSTLFAPAPAKPIAFVVYGTPRPQGSMKAFYIKTPTGGHPVLTSDNRKLKPWRQEITETARSLNCPMFPDSCPVEITLNFYFSRPKSVSARKRPAMTTKPDIDKTVRAIFDSLKGVLLHDDAQVIELHARKHYGGPERVEIRVQEAIP